MSCGKTDHKWKIFKLCQYFRPPSPNYPPPGTDFETFVNALAPRSTVPPADTSTTKKCPSCGSLDHLRRTSKKCPKNSSVKKKSAGRVNTTQQIEGSGVAQQIEGSGVEEMSLDKDDYAVDSNFSNENNTIATITTTKDRETGEDSKMGEDSSDTDNISKVIFFSQRR